MKRKPLYLLALLTLVMLSLLSCNRTTPAPTILPEPTATPTIAPTATATIEPTATATIEPTASPTPDITATPTANPIILRDDLYRNDALGIIWERPDSRWAFKDVSAANQPNSPLTVLVSLVQEPDAGNHSFILAKGKFPALTARGVYLLIKSNPDLALQNLAAGLGESGKTARLTSIAGAPAVVAEMPGAPEIPPYFLWTILQPKTVFYLTATGFSEVLEAGGMLRGLKLDQAIATSAPQITQPVDRALPALIAATEDLRELKTINPVPVKFMTREQVRDLLQSKNSDPARKARLTSQGQMFKLLGLMPEDTDLEKLLLDVYSSQIAGFYDDETKDFLIVQATGAVSATLNVQDKITFVHEYVHALQDQHFDLDRYIGKAAARMNNDQRQALLALVEGDAMLTAAFWEAENLTPSQIIGLDNASREVNTAVLDKAPNFLKESIAFPYTSGEAFIQQIALIGGWERVDQTWKDAPVSTEQILHPEKYPADVPSAVALPVDLADQLGDGWREVNRDVWGEFDLRVLLAEELPTEARAGADGWDGSEYVFLTRGDKRLFVMELAWDSVTEAQEGRKALAHWLDKRSFSTTDELRYQAKAQTALLRLQGDRLFLCLGDDAAAVNQVADIWGK